MSMKPGSRLRWARLSVVTLGFTMLSAPVAAASCAPPVSIEAALDQAQFAFVGTVKSLEHDGRLASFSVDEVWKGDVDTAVVVSGGPTLGEFRDLAPGESIVTSVDRTYEEGATYLVVPFGVEEGVYMDNGCSVTRVYDSSLDALRPLTAHAPTPLAEDGALIVARVALGLVALAAGAAVTVGILRRRDHTASPEVAPGQ